MKFLLGTSAVLTSSLTLWYEVLQERWPWKMPRQSQEPLTAVSGASLSSRSTEQWAGNCVISPQETFHLGLG